MLRLTDVILDCPDAMALAAFYAEVTGVPVKEGSSPGWASIDLGGLELAFTPVGDHRTPSWPDNQPPKQFHLDFEVDDLEGEEQRLLGLGATLLHDATDDDGYGWRVYADPVGHPFCLCRNRGVTWVDGRPHYP